MYFWYTYLTNLFYGYNKQELTNVEIQEQTASFKESQDSRHCIYILFLVIGRPSVHSTPTSPSPTFFQFLFGAKYKIVIIHIIDTAYVKMTSWHCLGSALFRPSTSMMLLLRINRFFYNSLIFFIFSLKWLVTQNDNFL